MDKKRLKIIFSSFDDLKNPYYGGGGASSIHEVAKRLTNDYGVTVITGKYPGSKDEVIDGVFYKRIGLAKINPKLAQLVFQFLLPYYAMRLDYNIWFESYTPPFSTAFLPLFTKKRIIGVTHLLGGREMSKHYKIPFYLIEELGLKTYKEIIVLNDSLRAQVQKQNSRARITIIPNGENQELINRKNHNRQEDYILFLGRIDIRHKGLDLLLDIYKNTSKDLGVELVIAGGGMKEDVAVLEKMINEKNLASTVRLEGKVVGDVKAETFRKAKILVMTSRIEGFPRVLLEAFCYEVPTIIFNIDTLNWVPDNVSVKIKPFNTSKFSEELVRLNNDSNLRKQLAENGKKFMADYDWDVISNKYKVLLNKLQ